MKKEKTVKKYLKKFKQLKKECRMGKGEIDKITLHIGADQLLLDALRELGFDEIADAYIKTEKSVDEFWYA